MTRYAVRPATAADSAAIDTQLSRQADRLEALDRRVRMPRSAAPGGLVAVDAGAIAGHLRPLLVEITAGDELLSFSFPRTVHWQEVVTADPVALAALAAASRVHGAADALLWPAVAGPAFGEVGLEPSFVFALRPPGPLPCKTPVAVRRAWPADTESLVALHEAEVAFHEPHTPYIRRVPGLEPAYRARLQRAWAGADPVEGASVIHVAEIGGRVVAMCESMLQASPAGSAASRLPAGRYGFLNSVSVAAAHRGAGIGRAVVAAAIANLALYGVDGYTLWLATGNPLARRVWPALGFRALWTRFERRP